MIINEYEEVLIIGAGPAGISAGIKFIEKGIDCCIIENQFFQEKNYVVA